MTTKKKKNRKAKKKMDQNPSPTIPPTTPLTQPPVENSNNVPKKTNKFAAWATRLNRDNKSRLLVFIVLFAAIGGFIIYNSFAANTVARIEAETMTGAGKVVSGNLASGKKALKLTTTEVASSATFTTSSKATQLTLRARGASCQGAPQVSISVDNQEVFVTNVSSPNKSWADFTGLVSVPAGQHKVSARLNNPYTSPNGCVRAAILDTITLLDDQPAPPPTDTVPPTVSITSPTANSVVSGSTSITANASDSSGISRIEFYVGTTQVSSITASPYTYEWDTSTTANGQYILKTIAYDGAGNAASSSITVTLTQVKPQIKGVVDRDGYRTNSDVSKVNLQVPVTHRAAVNNFVLMLNWSQIQPNSSSELVTTYIDDAIAEAKAANMRIKLRVMAGTKAPTWVKNLEGGPFNVYNVDSTTGQETTGTSPKYWTPGVKSAYSGLMSKLAAKYDKEPTIGGVVNSLCTTIYAEPFIRNLDEGNNFASYYGAGLTNALDQQCLDDSINIHNNHWKLTRTETAVNPLDYKGTVDGENVELKNTDFSIAWVEKCRQILGVRCVMGNNGFNATSGPNGSFYRKAIGAIICAGNPPPYFQTRQQTIIKSTGNTLADVLKYAIDVGAGMVEAPVQYRQTETISLASLTLHDTVLESNSVIACPTDRLLPNPS